MSRSVHFPGDNYAVNRTAELSKITEEFEGFGIAFAYYIRRRVAIEDPYELPRITVVHAVRGGIVACGRTMVI